MAIEALRSFLGQIEKQGRGGRKFQDPPNALKEPSRRREEERALDAVERRIIRKDAANAFVHGEIDFAEYIRIQQKHGLYPKTS